MVLKLAAPFFHDADRGHRCRISERAECAAQHVLREVGDEVDVCFATETGVKALERLAQPGGSFAARDAPATGLVRVEVHDAASHVHHAGVFVHYDHATGAQHRAGFGDRIVVHGDVNFVGGEKRAGASTGNDGFQFLAVCDAARHFVNELFHVHSERDFVNAGLFDVTCDAEHARAAIFRRPAVGIGFTAFANDGWDGAEGFHVVDDGGAAV